MPELFGTITQARYRLKVPQYEGFRGPREALLCKQTYISPVVSALGGWGAVQNANGKTNTLK